MKTNIDIGQLILTKLNEQKRSINWLAGELGIDCSNLHKTLKNNGEHINVVLLYGISVVMKCDFFACYSQQLQKNNSNIQRDL